MRTGDCGDAPPGAVAGRPGETVGWVAAGLAPGLAAVGALPTGASLAGGAFAAGAALAGRAEPPAAVTTTWPIICVGWTWQK